MSTNFILSRTLITPSSSSSSSASRALFLPAFSDFLRAIDLLCVAAAAVLDLPAGSSCCFPAIFAGGEPDGDVVFGLCLVEAAAAAVLRFGAGEFECGDRSEDVRHGDLPLRPAPRVGLGLERGLEPLLPLLAASPGCRRCFEECDDADCCGDGLVLRVAEGAGGAMSAGSGRDSFEDSFSSCGFGGELISAREDAVL